MLAYDRAAGKWLKQDGCFKPVAATNFTMYQRGMVARLRAQPNRVRDIDQEEFGLSISVPLSSAGPGGRAWRR